MRPVRPRDTPADLAQRVRELEASLERQQELTAQERARADRLEQTARVAWRLGVVGRPRRSGEEGHPNRETRL